MSVGDTLEFAKEVAKEAGAIMRQNFSLGMKKEWKGDNSPLTASDVAINQLVLEAVATSYPGHSFVGEEGSNIKESEYTWVCDPIDGTIPFSHGYPTFAFSLALTKNGEPIVGVIYDPIMDRLLTAEKGKGTFLNGKKISVSNSTKLGPTTFVEAGGYSELPRLQSIIGLGTGCKILSFYSCVYAGLLVATGEFVGQVYKGDRPWDAAGVKIIVEEAGGKVTDLAGNEQRWDGKLNGFIASNGLVHGELLAAVKEAI